MKKFFATIIVTLATVLTFNNVANADVLAVYSHSGGNNCLVYVDSWDISDDPITLENSEILDRIDLESHNAGLRHVFFSMIFENLPTFENQVTPITVFITYDFKHEYDSDLDIYVQEQHVIWNTSSANSRTEWFSRTLDNQSVIQTNSPNKYERGTVFIDVIAPEGIIYELHQVGMQMRGWTSPACPN